MTRVIAAGEHRYRVVERGHTDQGQHLEVWECERCGHRTRPDARFLEACISG